MKSILIVDDEPLLVEVLKEEVESAGYRAICATSATEAMEQLASGGIDLVISDVRMPCVSGTQLLTAIRQRWPRRPYVILMTGLTDVSTNEALGSGAQAVFGKPLSCEALRDKVMELLEGDGGELPELDVPGSDAWTSHG